MEKGFIIPVLNKGSVQLIDWMGSDERIADTARVSYAGDNLKRSSDENLIRYLMRHKHTSPFESCVVTLRIKMPIFIARQWVRHRTASMNEVSARYSVLPEEYYIPALENICTQATDNKQGSDKPLPENLTSLIHSGLCESANYNYEEYQGLLDMGVAKETARMVLSLNMYTEFYWTQNLHNLFHLVKLRSDPHAQWEIRQYAEAIIVILKELFPISYRAFEDYVKDAVTFSRGEMLTILLLLKDLDLPDVVVASVYKNLSKSEKKEFLKKLSFSETLIEQYFTE
jgi:thymidylate synthase (FAD)